MATDEIAKCEACIEVVSEATAWYQRPVTDGLKDSAPLRKHQDNQIALAHLITLAREGAEVRAIRAATEAAMVDAAAGGDVEGAVGIDNATKPKRTPKT